MTSVTPILLAAAWLAPMSSPVLPDAGVVFRAGRVVAFGTTAQLRLQFPDAVVHEAGDAVILPGLINAHTHLELSTLHRGDPPARFVDWIIGLMKQTGSNPEQSVQEGISEGIAQSLRFGITSVGDITSQPRLSRALLARSPLGGVSYGEVRAMAGRRAFLQERLDAAAMPITGSSRLRSGVTPHAPYSIETTGYQRCLATARAGHLPLATHLAETIDEASFLADHTGSFRELWTLLAAWDDDVPRSAGGPVRMARDIGLLDYPTLLAHVNYADDDEMDILAGGSASVVYCPRTHAFFGHPPHRWRDMLAHGIHVAVGTDSCASSPDLNLVDDLRLLHRIAPEVAGQTLWNLATVHAARAIGCADAGSISPGKLGDAVVFPARGDDPLIEILEGNSLPREVWIDGVKVGD
jgi:cytosine/adenosine deaminase-related metal-dependent hydrolase